MIYWKSHDDDNNWKENHCFPLKYQVKAKSSLCLSGHNFFLLSICEHFMSQ